MADMLRSDPELSSYPAVNAPTIRSIRQLRRCRLETQLQFKSPDCESEHNAQFHNKSREFVPPRPKKIEVESEVARRIRDLRESLGQSQTAFARSLGLPYPSNVSKWEAGHNQPEPQMYVRLANLADGELRAFFLGQAGITEGHHAALTMPSAAKREKVDLRALTISVAVVRRWAAKREKKTGDAEFAALVVRLYRFRLDNPQLGEDRLEEVLQFAS